jgi:hypothetical protein
MQLVGGIQMRLAKLLLFAAVGTGCNPQAPNGDSTQQRELVVSGGPGGGGIVVPEPAGPVSVGGTGGGTVPVVADSSAAVLATGETIITDYGDSITVELSNEAGNALIAVLGRALAELQRPLGQLPPTTQLWLEQLHDELQASQRYETDGGSSQDRRAVALQYCFEVVHDQLEADTLRTLASLFAELSNDAPITTARRVLPARGRKVIMTLRNFHPVEPPAPPPK